MSVNQSLDSSIDVTFNKEASKSSISNSFKSDLQIALVITLMRATQMMDEKLSITMNEAAASGQHHQLIVYSLAKKKSVQL